MRILFFPSGCLPFHNGTVDERPLGGTESGVIYLARALTKLGVETYIVSDLANPPLSHPLYIPSNAIQFIGEVDALIGVRDWKTLLLPIKAKKRFFWTGDAYDQPHTVGIGDKRVALKIDAFLAVSNWQAETLSKSSGYPIEQCVVIQNGVPLEYFTGTEKRNTNRLIYSSTPYRGLHLLPAIMRKLQQRHPEVELHVFSGYDVYKGDRPFDPHLTSQFNKLTDELSSIPHVFVHGNIIQSTLAREFMKSGVLAYPNIFPETSCITAMEAMAAGCVPVTSKLAALPETIGDAGILIPETPGSPEYIDSFTQSISFLIENPMELNALSTRGISRAQSLTWGAVAQKVLALL